MSSFVRRLGRNIARKTMTKEEIQGHKTERASQQFQQHEDGVGYDVYHATKGWRRISGKRVAAQFKMQQMGVL